MNCNTRWKSIGPKALCGVVASFALFGFVLAQASQQGKTEPPSAKASASKYIGAEKCKNCHQNEASGDQYGHWMKSGHAKAFETLASPEAKEIAKAKGIEDPQKSDQCLKCHQTAFGVAAEEIKKGFDAKKGVQCESCHGPGEAHLKARFAAAAKGGGDASVRQTVEAGEIQSNVEAATCLGCHNEESPTFKPFCIHERAARITHMDPRHKREEGKMICGCEAKDGCTHKCDDKCGGLPATK
ncbi:MAG: multiheme c-type cytochrome [Planctomycetota bacterium]